jgi:hypothetical protein
MVKLLDLILIFKLLELDIFFNLVEFNIMFVKFNTIHTVRATVWNQSHSLEPESKSGTRDKVLELDLTALNKFIT